MGQSGECEEGVGDEVAECRGGTLLIAAWAVGGEVSFYMHVVMVSVIAVKLNQVNSCEVE